MKNNSVENKEIKHLNVFFFPITMPKPRTMGDYDELQKRKDKAMAMCRQVMVDVGLGADRRYTQIVSYLITNVTNVRYFPPVKDIEHDFDMIYSTVVKTVLVTDTNLDWRLPVEDVPVVLNIPCIEYVLNSRLDEAIDKLDRTQMGLQARDFTYNPQMQEMSLFLYENKKRVDYMCGTNVVTKYDRFDVRGVPDKMPYCKLDVGTLPVPFYIAFLQSISNESVKFMGVLNKSFWWLSRQETHVRDVRRMAFSIYVSWMVRPKHCHWRHERVCDCDEGTCIAISWHHGYYENSYSLVSRDYARVAQTYRTLDPRYVDEMGMPVYCNRHKELWCNFCHTGQTSEADLLAVLDCNYGVVIRSGFVAHAIYAFLQINPHALAVFREHIIDYHDNFICLVMMIQIRMFQPRCVATWFYEVFRRHVRGALYEYKIGRSLVAWQRGRAYPHPLKDVLYFYKNSHYVRRQTLTFAENYIDCKAPHTNENGTLWYNVVAKKMVYESDYVSGGASVGHTMGLCDEHKEHYVRARKARGNIRPQPQVTMYSVLTLVMRALEEIYG